MASSLAHNSQLCDDNQRQVALGRNPLNLTLPADTDADHSSCQLAPAAAAPQCIPSQLAELLVPPEPLALIMTEPCASVCSQAVALPSLSSAGPHVPGTSESRISACSHAAVPPDSPPKPSTVPELELRRASHTASVIKP